ncbi:DUF169 domain-containing protein [Solirubrobacter taibaiensis]|nr:DUF169 domain-containing protein [Solirubrobacter taibaiensis]
MDLAALSEGLKSGLRLESPPVALCTMDEPPAGVALEGLAPSACTFWRRAEKGVFFVDADGHYGCPIGAMVMGFPLPDPVAEDLAQIVTAMGSCGYMADGEAQQIPTLSHSRRGILYGPLDEFPVEPEVVLIWLSPLQAMLYAESVGSVRWVGSDSTSLFGRPACAALAAARRDDGAALSLGCTGMRAFTEIGDDRLLAAVSGTRLQTLARELSETVRANVTMRGAYEQRKARLTQEIASAGR